MIKCEDWEPSGGLQLEPNALRTAKATTGCIALMAGPGAGKTEMLAQRADFLLRTGTCGYPKRILAISFKKDASENLKDRVAKRCGKDLASRFDSYTFHAFAKRIIDIFRPFLSGYDELDENYTIGAQRISRAQITFNDLVPLANEIVSNCSEAVNSIRQTYSDVFLDEFQDCTTAQYSLIKNSFLDSGARLIAVGDTKQMIMGWAGALEGIFQDFGCDFNAIPLNLYQNFRSLPRIRRVHNTMLLDVDPQAAVSEEQLAGDDGIVSVENFANDNVEADWIVGAIENWIADGVPLYEITVLCNTQPHLYANALMERLRARNIPYRNEQEVQDLFCEPIFKLIVDFLIVLLGTSEPDSWERLFFILAPDQFNDTKDSRARDWSQFIQKKQLDINGSQEFSLIWDTVNELLAKMDNEQITSLSHDYENRRRFNELVELTKVQIEDCFYDNENIVEAIKGLSEINAVRILTIHKCKGLEFDSVVVQGVENQTFFGKKTATECAFFVAISRAKRRLVITTSDYRARLPEANQYWRTTRTRHNQFLSYVTPHVGGEL